MGALFCGDIEASWEIMILKYPSQSTGQNIARQNKIISSLCKDIP